MRDESEAQFNQFSCCRRKKTSKKSRTKSISMQTFVCKENIVKKLLDLMKGFVIQLRDNFLCRVMAKKNLINSISMVKKYVWTDFKSYNFQTYTKVFQVLLFVHCKRDIVYFSSKFGIFYTYLKSFIIKNKVLVLLCIPWLCCILQFHVKILHLHRQQLLFSFRKLQNPSSVCSMQEMIS